MKPCLVTGGSSQWMSGVLVAGVLPFPAYHHLGVGQACAWLDASAHGT
jgi:hypothetical protein